MPDTAKPAPFVPVKRIALDGPGHQRLWPSVSADGTPVWQAGDGDPLSWPITSIGWCHGDPSNRRDTTGLRGTVHLTASRVVVTSVRYAKGTSYTAFGIGNQQFVAFAANKLSQRRARKSAAGTALVGQMRYPWVAAVLFGPPEHPNKRLRGEIRVCANHRNAFGEAELVILFFTLADPSQTLAVAEHLVRAVRDDRHGWSGTTEETRAALDAAVSQPPGELAYSPDKLPSVRLPGAYYALADTAGNGARSARSFQAGQAPTL